MQSPASPVAAARLNVRKIALVGKYQSRSLRAPLMEISAFAARRGLDVLIERSTAESNQIDSASVATLDEIASVADLAIVIGGDGTLLNVARGLVRSNIALVGVNQGRVGFLTDIALTSMLNALGDILDGKYIEEQRMLLQSRVERDGAVLDAACAFNDVVVSKGSTGRIIEFDVVIDAQPVYSQRSDGIVVATPTGSTAYALSAGGPIVHPMVPAIVLVPICPHTVNNRPIAINSSATVEICVRYAADARVHYDGQRHLDLCENDKVVITQAAAGVRLLHPLDYSYYAMLRDKLRWGESL